MDRHGTPSTSTRLTILGFAAGFAPWIVARVGAAIGAPNAGLFAAVALALAICLERARHGGVRALEAGALAFFAVRAAVALAFASDPLATFDAALGSAALAAIAWGTLAAGTPFTLQYARDSWPREYWDAPLFRRLNAALTAIWAAAFSLAAALGALAVARPGARVWLGVVAANLAIAVAGALSVVLPRTYPRRWAARQLAEREPYRWPVPAFVGGRARRTDRHDVIVVGAGIGGLTTAALLARRGLDVAVFDQHFLAGGFCTSWPRVVRRGDERLRYVFDAGVHDVSGLGPRGAVRHLLRALDLEQALDWWCVTHEYRLPDVTLRVPPRAEDFVAALAARFPAERVALHAFFAEMEAVYRELYADVDLTGGVPQFPATVEAMLAYPASHPHAFRWLEVPFATMLDRYFTDPAVKRVMSVLTGYLTDDPATLTAFAMAPIFGYYFDGGHYPAGGSQAFADALVGAIEAHAGRVLLRTPVRRIVVERDRAIGVELASGERLEAEVVVSNADVRRTFIDLVGRERLPGDFAGKVEALRPSASALMVFLGVDDVPEVAPLTHVADESGGLGIAIPSKVDPTLAPAGHSAITLIELARDGEAWDRRAPGYGARKRAAGDALIARAERALPGLRDHIVYRQDATPATFARYAWTTAGSIYGPALAQWRPPMKSPVERLLLAGAGVFPGAGVEAVVISGTLAANAICPSEAAGVRRTIVQGVPMAPVMA